MIAECQKIQQTVFPVPKPQKHFKSKKAKKKRAKKIKYLPISKLIDISWKAQSRYIRAVRDAAPDQIGFSVCYTCGKELRWQEAQCGHYIPKSAGGETMYDSRNLASQCESCNLWKKGNPIPFARNLVRDHGKSILDELSELRKKRCKHPHEYWVKRILKYERKLKEAGIDVPSRPPKLTID